MVVGNDDRKPERLRDRDRLDRRNPIINSNDQLNPSRRRRLDYARIDAVALVMPARNGIINRGTQMSQGPQQECRTGHPVGIIVAANPNRLPKGKRSCQTADCPRQIRKYCRCHG